MNENNYGVFPPIGDYYLQAAREYSDGYSLTRNGYKIDNAPAPRALTYDDGKAPLAQIPWAAIEGMAKVQAYGHKKYKDFNNYRKGMEVMRNLSCMLRHVKEYIEGNDLDEESGEPHLNHALTRLAFVIQNIADGTATDDRYKK
jgi:hypothetical protein